MKKLFSLLLTLLTLLSLAACAGDKTPTEATESHKADSLPTVLNQGEYVLYQNVFFNNMAEDYLGKTLTKEGTFTRLYDAFSQKTRYYVWGYMDATKCCDWQWEFVPKDPDSLPANGSLVKMTGVFGRDEAALDKLWFTDATVELETAYTGPDCDVDMSAMSATLERVQLLNMQYKPEAFEGQSLCLYGRILSPGTVQHPYYDNAWTQAYVAQGESPAIGTMVILSGTWSGDTVALASLTATSDY